MPLTVELTLVDIAKGGTPLAGAAVYLVALRPTAGKYSLYDQASPSENYLRGVQETDDDGKVTFTTIFPAAYSGRWPHIHFEVYPSLDEATAAGSKLKTSQLALPKEACDAGLRHRRLRAERRRTWRRPRSTPTWSSATATRSQLATVTGSVDSGYTVKLNVGV